MRLVDAAISLIAVIFGLGGFVQMMITVLAYISPGAFPQ
jgi:hypothetical protein